MNENKQDRMPPHGIDDLFWSAIDPFEESPSLVVWEKVEKDLDRYNIISIKKKYNTKQKKMKEKEVGNKSQYNRIIKS